jgi:hypothetical protein
MMYTYCTINYTPQEHRDPIPFGLVVHAGGQVKLRTAWRGLIAMDFAEDLDNIYLPLGPVSNTEFKKMVYNVVHLDGVGSWEPFTLGPILCGTTPGHDIYRLMEQLKAEQFEGLSGWDLLIHFVAYEEAKLSIQKWKDNLQSQGVTTIEEDVLTDILRETFNSLSIEAVAEQIKAKYQERDTDPSRRDLFANWAKLAWGISVGGFYE